MAKRDPLQVSPEFRIGIIQIQRKVELKENKRISIRELTERIVSSKLLDDIEKKLLGVVIQGDIKLNFDRRSR